MTSTSPPMTTTSVIPPRTAHTAAHDSAASVAAAAQQHLQSPTPPPASPSPSSSSVYLASGAVAGLSVDLVLYPLDTIKTRMQARGGLQRAGGFGRLFSGVASAAAGSAPTAALFFLTYEQCKHNLAPLFHPTHSPSATTPVHPLVHSIAACTAEVAACLVRVPTENVKQKVQAGLFASSWTCFRSLAASPDALRSFYRGFGSTILREIPFALIQFPLYEWSKWRTTEWRRQRGDMRPLDGWMCAALGSVAGGIAAASTTPLDVIKTRMMLHASSSSPPATAAAISAPPGVHATFRAVYAEGGVARLFAGVVPRVLWISLGGGVFFGAYEAAKRQFEQVL